MTTIAIYPATFDPITNGHLDIANRAARLFDMLIVGVYDRPLKDLLFSPEERWSMTKEAFADLRNVEVELYNGLTVEFAHKCGAKAIVRGLRVLSDFEWELQLALTNKRLRPDIDTVCLMASQEFSFLSSSVVKEVGMAGGDVSDMVPPHVLRAMSRKFDAMSEGRLNTFKPISLRD